MAWLLPGVTQHENLENAQGLGEIFQPIEWVGPEWRHLGSNLTGLFNISQVLPPPVHNPLLCQLTESPSSSTSCPSGLNSLIQKFMCTHHSSPEPSDVSLRRSFPHSVHISQPFITCCCSTQGPTATCKKV